MEKKISQSIKLGEMNALVIDRFTPPGIYLMSIDDESVLLPNAYVKESMQVEDIIEVFIYTDSQDKMIATTLTPLAKVNEFALLKVVDVTSFGAFVDIGLLKDLLVPKNRQKNPFTIGEKRFVRVVVDESSQRLIGVEKFDSYIKRDLSHFKINEEVNILVFAKTPLGFKVIVNHDYEGMIYHNEIFETIQSGDKKRAYIKNIREDGKLDIILQKIGSKANSDMLDRIVSFLEKNKGFAPYTYKSDSNDIQKIFSMSKKNFKATLSKLIEEKRIQLGDDGIKLIT